MFSTKDLLAKFSSNLSSSSNKFLSLQGVSSTFSYADSQALIKKRSELFDLIDPEKRPVLIFNQVSTEFIVNLLACWRSKRPVVPLCLPSSKRTAFINYIVDQTSSLIYTIDQNHSRVYKISSNPSSRLSQLAEVTPDSFTKVRSSHQVPTKSLYPLSTAVIQYSSGSTGSPKGVLITALNMASSLDLMTSIWDISSRSIFYSWLPLYHDLGFIFGVLLPLMNGCRSYILPSADFAKSPSIWLSHLSSFSITHTAGSTSGYSMATLQSYTDSISLTACKYCMIAAEHISSTVVSNFLDVATPLGLPPNALSAAYGLAESTLAVTADRIDDSLFIQTFDQASLNNGLALISATGRSLVSSGYSLPETTISIRDNQSILPIGSIGEVVVEGPTVMSGYLGASESSNSLLYTGDLGFLLEKRLFITGRKKELIIINGKNIYPEDLEHAVKSGIALLSNSTCVSFSIANDDFLDTIVFVAELDRHVSLPSPLPLFDQINQIVTEFSGCSCFDILLVKRAQIPKTTSGKLQRLKARELYGSDQFKVIHSYKSSLNDQIQSTSSAITIELLISWCNEYELKHNEPVLRSARGQTYFSLDSLGSSELKAYIVSVTGITLEDTFIWEFDTLEKLFSHLHSYRQ